MPIALEDDLDECLSEDNFATTATITIDEDTEIEVIGDFSEASDEVLQFGQVAVEAVKPNFTAKTSSVASVRPKMEVEINERNFMVEKVEKVGTGISVLYLKTQ